MPRVTAIVSAYFAEQFIEGRMQNLLAQKPQPEIIVVCQRDSGEHRAMLHYENEKSVRLILTDDIPTVYAAWNIAIGAATGDYLTNANSDDRLYPSALAKLAAALDVHPKYAVAYANVDIVQELGGEPGGRYEWAEGGLEYLVMKGCFLGPMPMWRKSLHARHGLFDAEMHSAGDYEFWMRIAKGGEKFWHVKETCGAYLKRDDSAEHRLKLRSIWEQARARGRYREGVNALWTKPGLMTD
jgi:glycosyltransferase involved in cell wall biosynthesis